MPRYAPPAYGSRHPASHPVDESAAPSRYSRCGAGMPAVHAHSGLEAREVGRGDVRCGAVCGTASREAKFCVLATIGGKSGRPLKT
eukprot:4858003-Prymnesium_polylepis.1